MFFANVNRVFLDIKRSHDDPNNIENIEGVYLITLYGVPSCVEDLREAALAEFNADPSIIFTRDFVTYETEVKSSVGIPIKDSGCGASEWVNLSKIEHFKESDLEDFIGDPAHRAQLETALYGDAS